MLHHTAQEVSSFFSSSALVSSAAPSAALENRASFSFWAWMKASLKALASTRYQYKNTTARRASCFDSLSELAKRMARVTASGSPSLTSAAAFHTQLRSEPTLGESFISGTTVRIQSAYTAW